MPVYEYKCPKCGTIYEVTRKIDERDKSVKCKKDGSLAERIMSGFASKIGFYIRPPAPPVDRKVKKTNK